MELNFPTPQRLVALLASSDGFGTEATDAELAARAPVEAYIRTALDDMPDPEITLVAGNLRNFWSLYLESLRPPEDDSTPGKPGCHCIQGHRNDRSVAH